LVRSACVLSVAASEAMATLQDDCTARLGTRSVCVCSRNGGGPSSSSVWGGHGGGGVGMMIMMMLMLRRRRINDITMMVPILRGSRPPSFSPW
jgi:hypothetical protein